jgi:hypothetical protein
MYVSAYPTYINATILFTILNIYTNMAFHGMTPAFQPVATQHA